MVAISKRALLQKHTVRAKGTTPVSQITFVEGRDIMLVTVPSMRKKMDAEYSAIYKLANDKLAYRYKFESLQAHTV